MLNRLVDVDQVKTAALIATITIDDQQTQVGVARYAPTEQTGVCEFAVVIADDWQGKGLATHLMQLLITMAYSNGYQRMVGDILANNAQMQALARALGFKIHYKEAGVVEATIELPH